MSATQPDETRPLAGSAQAARPLHLNWSEVPVEQVGEGIERQMVVGEKMMVCRLRFAPFVVTPEHEHTHEQMTIVERGRVRFFIEGEERIASPGDVLHFPSGCWHGATMLDEEVVLVDIFTPLREDFLSNQGDVRESGRAK
ncbi:MAG TPA: cupin domain-containing protein [Pyrinomonadaceae bacterium]|jgi:quercetin dioxygenase-like cupin family protein